MPFRRIDERPAVYITSRVLNGTEPFARSLGLDPQRLAEEAGVDLSLAQMRDAFIPFDRFLAFLELGAARSGDDSFGIRLAESSQHAVYGLYHYIIVNSPTLEDALAARIRFMALVANGYTLALDRVPRGAHYRWVFPANIDERTQYSGYVVSLLVTRIRQMLEQEWLPLEVSFDTPRPRAVDQFHRLFGPAVRFGARSTYLAVDKASLERRLPRADGTLHAEIEAYGRSLLGITSENQNFVARVSELISRDLAQGRATEQGIAQELGIAPSRLRRELKREGTNFRKVCDDTRREMAVHFLEKSDLSLTEMAFLLGFSELSAFSRQAKIWFGKSPSAFRKRSA